MWVSYFLACVQRAKQIICVVTKVEIIIWVMALLYGPHCTLEAINNIQIVLW